MTLGPYYRQHFHSNDQVRDPATGEPGEQRIRLLGPYSWTWDGPAFEGSGDTLFNLSSGQILLAAWCLVDTAFNPETDPLASVILSIGNTSIRGWQTTNASTAGGASEGIRSARLAGADVDSVFGEFDLPAMFGGTGAPVKIRGYYEGAGPLTQGEGRIYALIGEPA